MIKIIDVTLRDGGYKNNFQFKNDFVERIVENLDFSNMEYIEVGYRNGSFKKIENIGASGVCTKEYLEFCRRKITRSKLTVMLHPKNVNEDDIKEMQDSGVDTLRVCFPATDHLLGEKCIEIIKKLKMEFFINITRASQYSRNELTNLVVLLSKYNPNAIYLADSNGSLAPEEVGNLFMHLNNHSLVPLGFHAHDNLFLAQANAISAIKNGVKYIDSSLYGLGKGAGNLRTEGFISYLCSKRVTKYNLDALVDAANLINSEFSDKNAVPKKDIIMGIFDLSQDDATKLGSFVNFNEYYQSAKKYSEIIR